MARWFVCAFVLVGFVVACKKKQEPEPEPVSTAGTSGRSVTKIKDDDNEKPVEDDKGSSKSAETPKRAAPEEGSARVLYGGNGAAAYRDSEGHIHGPGGSIFMGKGPECTEKIDHCMRDGVWFAVPAVKSGNIYRATPAFEFENKWWTFNERPAEYDQLLKTKVVESSSDLVVGSPVVFLVEDNYVKWLDNEHDALTSSRWEVGLVEAVNADSTFRVSGWRYPVPNNTGRVVVESKGS